FVPGGVENLGNELFRGPAQRRWLDLRGHSLAHKSRGRRARHLGQIKLDHFQGRTGMSQLDLIANIERGPCGDAPVVYKGAVRRSQVTKVSLRWSQLDAGMVPGHTLPGLALQDQLSCGVAADPQRGTAVGERKGRAGGDNDL